MIKDAQTKLGGMKKKIQRIQKNWASHKNSWYDDAQPSEKKNEKPKPNTGGHDKPFWKYIQMTKGQETSTSDP
jgi:hypothetical protein